MATRVIFLLTQLLKDELVGPVVRCRVQELEMVAMVQSLLEGSTDLPLVQESLLFFLQIGVHRRSSSSGNSSSSKDQEDIANGIKELARECIKTLKDLGEDITDLNAMLLEFE